MNKCKCLFHNLSTLNCNRDTDSIPFCKNKDLR